MDFTFEKSFYKKFRIKVWIFQDTGIQVIQFRFFIETEMTPNGDEHDD